MSLRTRRRLRVQRAAPTKHKHPTKAETVAAFKAPHPSALLLDKAQTAVVLNTSTATVDRLVQAGVLKRVKLFPNSPSAKSFFTKESVLAVAAGRALADEAAS